jgi:hypothetical protein
MTSNDFRRCALSMPAAVEAQHMGHPDFRVGGKIFATLGYPNDEWGMVKLSCVDQEKFVGATPGVFVRVKGAWGRAGATSVLLSGVTANKLQRALTAAWRFSMPVSAGSEKKAKASKTPTPQGRGRA